MKKKPKSKPTLPAPAPSVSPIAAAAKALGDDILQLQRLSGQLSNVEVGSDSGLDRARVLLKHFTECSQRIGEEMQALGRALDEGRAQVETAVETVSERANTIRDRQLEAELMLGRFNTLSEMVRKVTEAIAPLQASKEESQLLAERLPEIQSNLGVLIDEARSIKNDAHAANMKTMESNADSLMHSLQTIQHKLQSSFDQLS